MSRTKSVRSRGLLLAAVTVVAGALLAGCGGVGSSTSTTTASSQSFKLQSEFVKLVQDVGPSVVMIETNKALGSGIVYDAKSDIVTNNHVVAGYQNFLVITSTGKQSAQIELRLDRFEAHHGRHLRLRRLLGRRS